MNKINKDSSNPQDRLGDIPREEFRQVASHLEFALHGKRLENGEPFVWTVQGYAFVKKQTMDASD